MTAGEAEPPPLRAVHDPWRFEIAAYLWLPDIDGPVGAAGIEGTIDWGIDDWVDVIDDAGLAGIGSLEVGYGRFGAFFETYFYNLESRSQSLLFNESVDLRRISADLGVSYTVYQREASTELAEPLRVDVLGGLRYSSINIDVRLSPRLPIGSDLVVSRTEEWVEPFIGARAVVPLSERWSLLGRLTLGGFDVGSRLTWDLMAAARYRVTSAVTVLGGYRIIDIDYNRGSGLDEFLFDVQAQAPFIALVVSF